MPELSGHADIEMAGCFTEDDIDPVGRRPQDRVRGNVKRPNEQHDRRPFSRG